MQFLYSKQIVAWYFILPVLIVHLLVVAVPSILSLALCITDWSGFGKINYVGLENFVDLFDDRAFKKAVKHKRIIYKGNRETVRKLSVKTCLKMALNEIN